MATCPRCGTALKDEYGMSQCPACGAFSFIDMDGNAVIQQEEAPAADAELAVDAGDSSVSNLDSHYNETSHAVAGGAAAPPDFSDPIESLIDVNTQDVAPPEAVSSAGDFGAADGAGGADGFGSGDFKPFDPFEQTPQDEPQPFDAAPVSSNNDEFQPIDMAPVAEPEDAEGSGENTNASTNSGFHAGPKPIVGEPSFGPASDPLNLNEFANSEISAAKDGPLLFRVLISGIDTREIRESIREVLEDPRFAWDSNEIFSKVSKGHLAIDGLSPVKASILITRIKRLPVEIRWEQYAIAQGQL